MLAIKKLVHSYGSDTRIGYADWEVNKHDHSLILGGSGSGKTTLLHLIGGLLKPAEGKIWINDLDISQMKPSALDRFRGSNIGIVFQRPHLIRSLSVLENLTLAQYLANKKIEKKEALRMLEQLDIVELKNRKVEKISQGQAQRVSIGRALLNKPKLLLADEPTSSLDDANCKMVIALLKQQAEQTNSTLIVATHDQRVKNEFKNAMQL